jgi:hypothetical protein
MPNDKFKPSPCPFCGQDTDYKIEHADAVEMVQIGFGDPPWVKLPERFIVTCNRCESVWFEPPVKRQAAGDNGFSRLGIKTESAPGVCCTVGDCPICNRTGMVNA